MRLTGVHQVFCRRSAGAAAPGVDCVLRAPRDDREVSGGRRDGEQVGGCPHEVCALSAFSLRTPWRGEAERCAGGACVDASVQFCGQLYLRWTREREMTRVRACACMVCGEG